MPTSGINPNKNTDINILNTKQMLFVMTLVMTHSTTFTLISVLLHLCLTSYI